MKIRELIKGVVKRRQSSERGTSRLLMAVFFIAGMVTTAALAQTPVAADIFSPRVIHEPVVPALPTTPGSLKDSGSPDNSRPVKPGVCKLVYAIIEEATSPC